MFNLSETAKIRYHYEPFTTTGAIFRETDRTNLYFQYYYRKDNQEEMEDLFWIISAKLIEMKCSSVSSAFYVVNLF